MPLGDRGYGYELSEIEKEFLFNRVDAGFVRYNTENGRSFYLDPSPYLKTPKAEIFVAENCQPPRNREFVEVSVCNVEDVIRGVKGGYSKSHKKYISSWKTIDPTIIHIIAKRRKLLDTEDVTNFFKSPYLGDKDIIEGICLCSALYAVSSPPVSNEIGGINAAVMGKKRPWGGFKTIMGVIPKEFQQISSRNFYKISDKETMANPKESLEVNLAYLNPESIPMHIPLALEVEAKTLINYKENIKAEIPMMRAYILDSLIIQPAIPNNLESYLTDSIYSLRNDFKGAGWVPYKQDLGSVVPKISLSFARLHSELKMTKKDIEEAVDLWSKMFYLAKKAVSTPLPVAKLYKLGDNERKLYIELTDIFGADVSIPEPEAIKNTSLSELDYDEAIKNLNIYGLIIKMPNKHIKVLELS
jgi:hypothetical protein